MVNRINFMEITEKHKCKRLKLIIIMTEICDLHHCDENQFILNEAGNKALPF